MTVIEHENWICPRCDSVNGPTRGRLCVICLEDDGAHGEVVGLARADQLAGAVKDFETLRAAVQNVIDAGFNYPEEYRDSLQQALDDDIERGQSREIDQP